MLKIPLASLEATRLHHTLITTRPEVGRRGERRGCGQRRREAPECVYVCACLCVCACAGVCVRVRACIQRVSSKKETREKMGDVAKREKEKRKVKDRRILACSRARAKAEDVAVRYFSII